MRRSIILLLSTLLLVGFASGAKGPQGGPPFNTWQCQGTLTVTTSSGSTMTPWQDTLFFYLQGKKKRFATTQYLGRWSKKSQGAADWRGKAIITKKLEKAIQFNEPGVRKARVKYRYKDLEVNGNVMRGTIQATIKRKFKNGTTSLETHDGSFTGIGS